MTDDKSAVEKLAERWKSGEGDLLPDWDPTDEAARLLLAAIEADRAAGWFGPPEAWRSFLSVEWERIAKSSIPENHRLRSKLIEVRALADKWETTPRGWMCHSCAADNFGDAQHYVDGLRSVVDRE